MREKARPDDVLDPQPPRKFRPDVSGMAALTGTLTFKTDNTVDVSISLGGDETGLQSNDFELYAGTGDSPHDSEDDALNRELDRPASDELVGNNGYSSTEDYTVQVLYTSRNLRTGNGTRYMQTFTVESPAMGSNVTIQTSDWTETTVRTGVARSPGC